MHCNRSSRVAFLKANFSKYSFIALLNLSSPIKLKSYLRTAAPFEYVIPSKIESAASVSGTWPAIGWVDFY